MSEQPTPVRYSLGMDRKMHKRAIPLILAGITASTFLGGCSHEVTDDSVPRISVTEVSRRLDRVGRGVELLDARDRASYERSHIPGARHVTLPEIHPSNPTPSLVGRGTLIVYGEHPGSATALAIAKRLIRTMDRVEFMEQGFSAWVERGLPTSGTDHQ